MSLAPASSRGAFLKARLAVNGIQCAARSLGTLTAAGRGLLSSIGTSSKFWIWRLFKFWDVAAFAQAISFVAILKRRRVAIFPSFRGDFTSRRALLVGGPDPEPLALGFLGIEPQQRQLWKCGLEGFAA